MLGSEFDNRVNILSEGALKLFRIIIWIQMALLIMHEIQLKLKLIYFVKHPYTRQHILKLLFMWKKCVHNYFNTVTTFHIRPQSTRNEEKVRMAYRPKGRCWSTMGHYSTALLNWGIRMIVTLPVKIPIGLPTFSCVIPQALAIKSPYDDSIGPWGFNDILD